ncbi:unnamed protein product [Prorocentrum cordatum]|uniref:Fibronectin type-III domain-containing protein n=1 Tax=Prorocentrum cordatum TaxID=2364126 RepID=A0ABN9RI16_9DINO|nr:unnamed protein product [Polarella glacialis]
MAPGERPEQAKGSPAAGAEGEAAEARERLFAAALLGHSADACGETLCNFRVTHLPSGHSWYLRRGLQEWLELQESIHWEIEAGVHKKGEGKGPKAAERPGDVHPGLLRVARSACASVLGGGLGRSSGSRAPRMSGAMIGGAVAADVQRRQRQTEALQAQLSQMLSDPRLRHSGALQRFLGIQLPEVPSLVRVARLQPDPMVWRPEDGDAALIEGTVEVTIRDVLDEASPDSGEAPALATHVVATVAAVVESDRSVDMCSDVDLIPVTEIEMPVVVPMQIVVGGLRPLSAYEFEVCAANAVGRSGSVRIRVLVPSASMLAGELASDLAQSVQPRSVAALVSSIAHAFKVSALLASPVRSSRLRQGAVHQHAGNARVSKAIDALEASRTEMFFHCSFSVWRLVSERRTVQAEHNELEAIKSSNDPITQIKKAVEEQGSFGGTTEEQKQKPMMTPINKMRAQLCWSRPDIWNHRECLLFLGLRCKKEQTGMNICSRFLERAPSECGNPSAADELPKGLKSFCKVAWKIKLIVGGHLETSLLALIPCERPSRRACESLTSFPPCGSEPRKPVEPNRGPTRRKLGRKLAE